MLGLPIVLGVDRLGALIVPSHHVIELKHKLVDRIHLDGFQIPCNGTGDKYEEIEVPLLMLQ
jgi:hypothetical protein